MASAKAARPTGLIPQSKEPSAKAGNAGAAATKVPMAKQPVKKAEQKPREPKKKGIGGNSEGKKGKGVKSQFRDLGKRVDTVRRGGRQPLPLLPSPRNACHNPISFFLILATLPPEKPHTFPLSSFSTRRQPPLLLSPATNTTAGHLTRQRRRRSSPSPLHATSTRGKTPPPLDRPRRLRAPLARAAPEQSPFLLLGATATLSPLPDQRRWIRAATGARHTRPDALRRADIVDAFVLQPLPPPHDGWLLPSLRVRRCSGLDCSSSYASDLWATMTFPAFVPLLLSGVTDLIVFCFCCYPGLRVDFVSRPACR
ncbi:uncharacterized protein LOC122048214 [Zingiber officinale]|uniref:uncharacterized protein LOC122048214 n=1 Tax=Zingiber officinale TaxID=94328 RepID=UPI001C4D4E04|nr:uncharacterized protein LOC122048214 [Zingiber officinale]